MAFCDTLEVVHLLQKEVSVDMEMDWMEQLQEQIEAGGPTQVSIDGQIWTINAADSAYALTNQFGNTDTYETPEQLVTSLQSRFENPTIVVL